MKDYEKRIERIEGLLNPKEEKKYVNPNLTKEALILTMYYDIIRLKKEDGELPQDYTNKFFEEGMKLNEKASHGIEKGSKIDVTNPEVTKEDIARIEKEVDDYCSKEGLI